MATANALSFEQTHDFVDHIFGADLHAKRVLSLSNATVGVMRAGSLAIHAIGEGLAHARKGARKHGIKQVDRLLSNPGIKVWDLLSWWVGYVVGKRESILVALDWTEFDADGHSTIMLSLVTGHGRATPLVWKTVKKSELKGQRNVFEDEVLFRLQEALPAGVRVTVMADRGFGDHKLYRVLSEELGFGYIIRFKANIEVTSAEGKTRAAGDWVPRNGRIKVLRNARVTEKGYEVGAVVCVKKRGMKEAWCLAVSDPEVKGAEAVNCYAKRWGIEICQPCCLLKDVLNDREAPGQWHRERWRPVAVAAA